MKRNISKEFDLKELQLEDKVNITYILGIEVSPHIIISTKICP